jgi:hypothetical protein
MHSARRGIAGSWRRQDPIKAKRPDDRRGPIKLAVFGSKMVHPRRKRRTVLSSSGRSPRELFTSQGVDRVVNAAFHGDIAGPEVAAD